MRLSFHFTYDADEEIRDFEIYLSIVSRMLLLYPHTFKGFFEDDILYIRYDIRYIDHIFLIWEHGEDSLKQFIETPNACHPNIKFTAE